MKPETLKEIVERKLTTTLEFTLNCLEHSKHESPYKEYYNIIKGEIASRRNRSKKAGSAESYFMSSFMKKSK